jgi:polysaccharide export outer membrane protein
MAGLASCAYLPEDGPSSHMVAKSAQSAQQRYALVDLDYKTVLLVDSAPSSPLATLTESQDAGPSDLIAVGDILAVSVFEPSGSMSANQITLASGETTPTETLPRVEVDRDGAITVPFGGSVRVVGRTASQAAIAIKAALKGKVADPQVVVSRVTSPRNSVIVIGEVKTPGRFPLVANSDRLLDALAAAGGPTKEARDLTLTVVRGEQSAAISVQTLLQDPAENIRLSPRDQIRVTDSPRKVDVFGAVGKGAEVPIEDDTLTLAGALARIGGLNGNTAEAKSVLLFRFERPEVAKALGVAFPYSPDLKGVPIIYRVNLRDPSGYFVANKFEVVANDLVYVPTADAAELSKFLNIVNSAAQLVYDAAVAKSLGL